MPTDLILHRAHDDEGRALRIMIATDIDSAAGASTEMICEREGVALATALWVYLPAATVEHLMLALFEARRRSLDDAEMTEVESLPADVAQPVRPTLGSYASVQEPPPEAPLSDLPVGFVRIDRVDSSPTKKAGTVKYFVTWREDGRTFKASTINAWLASMAEKACEEHRPVKVKTEMDSQWGLQLKSISTGDEAELPLVATDDLRDEDIPF